MFSLIDSLAFLIKIYLLKKYLKEGSTETKTKDNIHILIGIQPV